MTLGLLKSSLKLLFLNLEPPPLFVQLVDGAATVAKLIKQILDLVGEVLEIFSQNGQTWNKIKTLFSRFTTSSCSMVSS